MIIDLLKGRVSLVNTFWVFGIIPLVIYKILGLVIEHYYLDLMMLSKGKWLIYLYVLFPFIYFPFTYFAIWKSANNYTKKKVWANLAKIVVVIGFALLLINGLQILNELSNNKTSLKNLHEEIYIINKSLPFKIDSEIELTKVSFNQNLITYNYRLFNQNLSKIDREKFSATMREKLREVVCTSEELKPYLSNGISISYNYIDQNNKDIDSITVNPSDCQ